MHGQAVRQNRRAAKLGQRQRLDLPRLKISVEETTVHPHGRRDQGQVVPFAHDLSADRRSRHRGAVESRIWRRRVSRILVWAERLLKPVSR